MADFVQFNQGSDYLALHGWPTTTWFLLSIYPVGVLDSGTTLNGGVGEIAGTGYQRISQATPASLGGVISFAEMTWAPGAAANWPNNVVSIVAATTSDNSGVAICAWNLQIDGLVRDLSLPGSVEHVSPTYVA